jgi:hypothetical protein
VAPGEFVTDSGAAACASVHCVVDSEVRIVEIVVFSVWLRYANWAAPGANDGELGGAESGEDDTPPAELDEPAALDVAAGADDSDDADDDAPPAPVELEHPATNAAATPSAANTESRRLVVVITRHLLPSGAGRCVEDFSRQGHPTS